MHVLYLIALYLIAGAILLLGILLATRALAKERRAFAQREDFLRAATHELKTPLASLRLLLESLVSGRIAGSEKQAEYLRLMQGETERLSGLVGQALDFRRVDQGDIEIACRSTDLHTFLSEMESLYGPQLEREGRRLELTCPREVRAWCDPALLRRGKITEAQPDDATTFRIGDLEVDLSAYRLRGSSEIPLSPKEAHILEALHRRRGQVVTRDQILDRVWGPGF